MLDQKPITAYPILEEGHTMGKKKTVFQWDSEELENDVEEPPSRRSLKREDNEHKTLVKALVALKPHQWKPLPMSDACREALAETYRLKTKKGVRGGLRRQMLRMAAVLRDEDIEAIQKAMKR
jgi:ribosomal 50S subunit-associated protein YjgA (DUF615 family)